MLRRPVPVGPDFQETTKYHFSKAFNPGLHVHPAPPLTVYDASLRRVELPRPDITAGPALWETIARRRSRREFTGEAITQAQLSQLLWAMTGVTFATPDVAFRAAGSAGGLYPNDTYLAVNAVEGLPPCLAFYEIPDHRLCVLGDGAYAGEIARAALGQTCCATAAVVFVWAAVIARCAWKYSDRAYRYIYLDGGHLGAHGQLAAEALGLGSVNIGAFYDDEVAAVFGLDSHQQVVIYMMAVGHPAA
jgi:SagB-type dehydrogenase family enzyme